MGGTVTHNARLLGSAYRDDDSLPVEVALILIRRYANGNGGLVNYLRQNPGVTSATEKTILFTDAKWACREVLPSVASRRRRSAAQSSESSASFDFREASPVWDSVPSTGLIDLKRGVEQFINAISVLLSQGEQAWNSFVDEGLVDPSEWTEDQKWTAIALMWGFSVGETTVIRHAAGAPEPANDAGTRRRMTVVRRKGRALLEAMPPADRLEHDLARRTLRESGGQRIESATPTRETATSTNEPGDPDTETTRFQNPALYWVSDFPRDDKALRRRVLFLNDTYRLTTGFTGIRPAPGMAAQVTGVDPGYVNSKVQFEVTAFGAEVRHGDDDDRSDAPFSDRLRSEPLLCEANGTASFAVDVRAD